MAERKCIDCAYCDEKKFHCGKWYCMNPEVSVFNLPVPINKPCFKPRKRNNEMEG